MDIFRRVQAKKILCSNPTNPSLLRQDVLNYSSYGYHTQNSFFSSRS